MPLLKVIMKLCNQDISKTTARSFKVGQRIEDNEDNLMKIFINDIVEEINSSIRLFAADTSLYIIVDDPLDAAIKLNADLSRIDMWASMWLVTFNPSKSESLMFSIKVNKPYHPPIDMNYQHVNELTRINT